jgi:hypothetical protein
LPAARHGERADHQGRPASPGDAPEGPWAERWVGVGPHVVKIGPSAADVTDGPLPTWANVNNVRYRRLSAT